MLKHTFCHVPGVGPTSEKRLWEAGIDSWEKALTADKLPLGKSTGAKLQAFLERSSQSLQRGDAEFFAEHLSSAEHWRLFPTYRDSVAYVDIETTGLGGPGDYITTIVLYDGDTLRHYVQGQNLLDFKNDIAAYQLLVTFNGKTFDAPFIRNYLHARLPQVHIDLRYVLSSMGLRGGLKNCERQLGIGRDDVQDIDGYFAVLLWWDYHNGGNAKALETLLAYNAADVVNLEHLMVLAFNMKLRSIPFATHHRIADPHPPEIPFKADPATVTRLRRSAGWNYGGY
jgi:uncharacterized protein YprB with RNaseH-like and TPR domain